MNLFNPTPLSAAGMPILHDEEVEIKNEDSVSVLLQEEKKVVKELFSPGIAVLTNIRLIIIVPKECQDSLHKADSQKRFMALVWFQLVNAKLKVNSLT